LEPGYCGPFSRTTKTLIKLGIPKVAVMTKGHLKIIPEQMTAALIVLDYLLIPGEKV